VTLAASSSASFRVEEVDMGHSWEIRYAPW